jgi:hypothetical protein
MSDPGEHSQPWMQRVAETFWGIDGARGFEVARLALLRGRSRRWIGVYVSECRGV